MKLFKNLRVLRELRGKNPVVFVVNKLIPDAVPPYVDYEEPDCEHQQNGKEDSHKTDDYADKHQSGNSSQNQASYS